MKRKGSLPVTQAMKVKNEDEGVETDSGDKDRAVVVPDKKRRKMTNSGVGAAPSTVVALPTSRVATRAQSTRAAASKGGGIIVKAMVTRARSRIRKKRGGVAKTELRRSRRLSEAYRCSSS